MKKRILSVLTLTCFLTGIFFPNMQAFAASGTPGQTITGEYVAIVNTDFDPARKQSTGSIVFDSNGGTATRSMSLSEEASQTEMMEDFWEMQEDFTPQEMEGQPQTLSGSPFALTVYSIGQEKTIKGKNFVCIGIGTNSYIWMEKSMYLEYKAAQKLEQAAAEMIYVYEGEPYQVLTQMSPGNIPYLDNSGKLSILLENTGGSSGYYGGEPDITAIHINTPAANNYTGGQFANKNGLLVHEVQHSLFRNLSCLGNGTLSFENSWLNEGLSVAAMDYTWGGADVNGWLSSINGNAQLRSGAPLLYKSYRGSTALDYGMQYAFVRYLSNQLAGGKYNPIPFFHAVYKTPVGNKNAKAYIEAIIKQYDSNSSLTFEDVIADFYVAMVSQAPTGSQGYGTDLVVREKITDYPVYMGTSGKGIELSGTAAIIVKTVNGSFTVPSDAGNNIRFIAFDKTANAVPADGSGTAGDPYLIKTPADLSFLALYSDAHFKLANNINMAANTGNYITADQFGGSLDGGSYTISNLSQPLVNVNMGIIKNVVINAAFTDEFMVNTGVLVNTNQGTIRGCGVTGTVNSRLIGANMLLPNAFGAIAGYNEMSAVIRECYSTLNATLNLSTNHGKIGGLVGQNVGNVYDSYATGSLTVTQNTTDRQLDVGGAIGSLQSYLSPGPYIENVYSTETISVTSGAAVKNIGRLLGNAGTRTDRILSSYALSGMNATGNGNSTLNASLQKTLAQMKTASTYTGWAFGAIWKMPVDGTPVFAGSSDIPAPVPQIAQTTYYVGELLNLFQSNLLIGSTTVPITEDMLTGFDSSTPGSKIVQGIYKGKRFSFTVEVKAPSTVKDLVLHKGAAKTSYVAGQTFESNGVVLRATLDGQQFRYIYSGFTHNKTGALVNTDTSVDYSYFGSNVTERLLVSQKTASSIRLIAPPVKLTYANNSKMDFTGMLLQIQYNDGSFSEVFDQTKLNTYQIGWLLKTSGTSAGFDPARNLFTADNGKMLYAKVGGSGAEVNVGTLSVKSPLKLDDELFVAGKGISAFFSSQSVTGGSGSYTSVLKPGTSYDQTAIKVINYPGRFGTSHFEFEILSNQIGTQVVTYIITDTVTGDKLEVHMTFVTEPPSTACEVLKTEISSGSNYYMGTISGSVITFKIPTGTDKTSLRYSNPNFSPNATSNLYGGSSVCNSSGTPVPLVVTAQDGVTSKTYTIVLIETDASNPLSQVSNLVWTGTKGSWSPVSGAAGYMVFLHKWDSSPPAQPSPEAIGYYTTLTEWDFTADIKTADNYIFKVIAVADGKMDSPAAMSTPVSLAPASAVTSIVLLPTTASAYKGNTLQLSAVVSGISSPDKTVTWSLKNATSSSTSISENGLLTVGWDETAASILVSAQSVVTPAIEGNVLVTVADMPQLPAPSNLSWNWVGTQDVTQAQALWNPVANAIAYRVTLLKDGVPIGDSKTVSGPTVFDFVSDITQGGNYSFRVEAIGDKTNFEDSTLALSPVHTYAPVSTVTGVSISPSMVTLGTGNSQQFTALVSGTYGPSQEVNWTVAGEASTATTIDGNGLLTIGSDETAPSLTVTAISVRDRNVTASAAVTVSNLPLLSAPANLHWNGKTASWTAVPNAVFYMVEFYKDGKKMGIALSVAETAYDFSAEIITAGNYVFKVAAVGDGISYANSNQVESGVYTFTQPPAVTSVAITPSEYVSVRAGARQQFVAIVSGTHNPPTTVSWQISGHSDSSTQITADGLLITGVKETASPITVTASSTYDTSKSASVLVTILPNPTLLELVKEEIRTLPAPSDVTAKDAAAIGTAKRNFDSLSKEEKAQLSKEERSKLSQVIEALPHITVTVVGEDGIAAENLGLVVSEAEICGTDQVTVTLSATGTSSTADDILIRVFADQSGSQIGQMYDLSLYKQVGTSSVQSISDTENIGIALPIPPALLGRNQYRILRSHSGAVTELLSEVKDNIVYFFSDQFSTFVLIHEKTAASTPESGEGNSEPPTSGSDESDTGQSGTGNSDEAAKSKKSGTGKTKQTGQNKVPVEVITADLPLIQPVINPTADETETAAPKETANGNKKADSGTGDDKNTSKPSSPLPYILLAVAGVGTLGGGAYLIIRRRQR